jgi:hypothetical protein
MANPERGEVAFVAGGAEYVLRLDAGATRELQDYFGFRDVDLFPGLAEAMPTVKATRALAFFGLKRSHPTLTMVAAGELLEQLPLRDVEVMVREMFVRSLPKASEDEKPKRKEKGETDSGFDWGRWLADAAQAGIFPEDFWRMTLREIAIVIEGNVQRIRSEVRRSLIQAHQTAMFSKLAKIPKLDRILKDFDRKKGPQPKDELRANLMAWAAATPGVRISKVKRSRRSH